MSEKELLSAIEHLSEEDKKRIVHAIDFVNIHHEGQIRKSGEPYTVHLFAVGLSLWNQFHDIDLTIGGLLHDTVEDCEGVTIKQIYQEFGEKVCFLVDAATKDEYSFYQYPDIVFEDKIERQLWAGMKDVRALLVKIADRAHNISTLEHLKPEKQIRMAFETQAIYEPLREVLLGSSNNTTISATQEAFDRFCSNSQSNSPKKIKEYLFKTSFKEFEDSLFELVYNNSAKIIWEIEDMQLMEQLYTEEAFRENTELLSLWTNKKQFRAQFQFKKGMVLNTPHTQFKIATLKQ